MKRLLVPAGALALLLLIVASGCGVAGRVQPVSTSGGEAEAWRLPDLADPGEQRSLVSVFNHGVGTPRLILLLSPTCPTCLTGASWVRDQILRRYPLAKVDVIAVWMPVLPGDSRAAWNDEVLDDARVTQLWDQDQVVGTWFQRHGGPFWDAFLYYRPDAHWRNHPTDPDAWGSTILGSTGELEHALSAMLSRSSA